ncbi:MAG: gliding motility-associated C-terminal domain-containing protein [Bacteroidetes bacterium]|nr:gliding motility-associated C-terminal domain-containing protein [Fibrella sp.]
MFRLFLTVLLLQAGIAQALPGSSIVFVQNKGQWPTDVRFRVDVPGGFLFLKERSLHYVFYDTNALADHHASRTRPTTDAIRAHGVDVQFTGSQTPTLIEGIKPADVLLNYFLGNDPAHHVSQAPAFGEVIYRDIYPGTDLRIYTFYETLKYEFTVRPGADPDRIRLLYAGADAVNLTNGKLVIQTSVTTFQEKEPYSYVSRDGRATDVKTDWAVAGNEARFVLPNGYDKSQPLTIDPELVFVTYSGSRNDNWAHTATYDANGNLYSGGSIFGVNFPATTGAFQVNFGGIVDVALLKFSADGTNLLYGTFLGGRNADLPHSMVVNGMGELIVMGTTSSPDFPTTVGAYQRTPGLSAPNAFTTSTSVNFVLGSDLFVAKLSANGQQLRAGTLMGGSGNDGVGVNAGRDSLFLRNYGDDLRGEVIVGPDDDVYVASVTASANFPVTDQSPPKGGQDAVVFRLSADLNQLRWSTRISGSRFDGANGIKLTASGILYVCGITNSADLPATATALHPRPLGIDDGFVARYDNQQLTQLTYLGTNLADGAYLIDTGPDGSPHVFGLSRGRYPVSAGVFSSAGSGQFIQALDANLTQSVFSTVIGSGRTGPDISPTAFLVNECGNIYLAGWGGIVNASTGNNRFSSTANMPISEDPYQRITTGNNFYLGVLERNARSLLYGTFLGGTSTAARGDHVDGGTCRFDKNGVVYHAACVCLGESSFPATPVAWSRTNNSSNCNSVAFKFDTDKLKAAFDTYAGTQKNVVEGCTPLALNFRNTSIGGKRYEWDVAGLAKSTDPAQTSFTFTQAGQYVVTLRAYNPLTCKLVDSTQQIINVRPSAFSLTPDTTICARQSVQLVASGGITYRWAAVAGLSSTTLANPVATPNVTTTYSVTITNAFGCSTVKTQTITQDVSFTPTVSVNASVDCGQPMQLSFTNATPNADSLVWALGNGDTLRNATPTNYTYAESGRYDVTVTAYRRGCPISAVVPVTVENLSEVPNVITANNDGKNDLFTVGIPNSKLQIVNRWGRLIYESNPYQNDWGRNVPNGLYYFLLTTPGGTECKGWLQVLE